jgi:Protein of unknown function (DUF2480)
METQRLELEIVNRVANSGLVTLDLKDYYPTGKRIIYDIGENLFEGLILREKDFRQFLKENDWSKYQDANVAITCSADAIVPMWAYMLLAVHLESFASNVMFGNTEDLEKELFRKAMEKIDLRFYENKKVVIKGCSDLPIPTSAYVEITRLLKPYVQSIMYGEPCSTVPIYKRPKTIADDC